MSVDFLGLTPNKERWLPYIKEELRTNVLCCEDYLNPRATEIALSFIARCVTITCGYTEWAGYPWMRLEAKICLQTVNHMPSDVRGAFFVLLSNTKAAKLLAECNKDFSGKAIYVHQMATDLPLRELFDNVRIFSDYRSQ